MRKGPQNLFNPNPPMLHARGLGPENRKEQAQPGERKMDMPRFSSRSVELETIGWALPLGAACVGGHWAEMGSVTMKGSLCQPEQESCTLGNEN